MKQFSAEKLASVLGAEVVPCSKAESRQIAGVSIDSRTVGAGDCFFAIDGESFDGHDYIAEAFGKGAVCAVVSENIDTDVEGVILKVSDTVKALGELAKWYRGSMGFKVVAITGSAGKTTTRQITCHALSGRYKCYQAPKSFNNNIGVPLTILGADESCEIVIAELGSNRPSEISDLTAIAGPDIALITNIHPAHLEGFGSIEAIIKEKASIAEGLGSEGRLFVNGDFDELVAHCAQIYRNFRTFGQSRNCDIRAANLITKGTTGELTIDDVKISVPLPGKANLANTLAGWALCKEFGLSLRNFAEAVQTLEVPKMRLQIQTLGPITLINDCYNANPASMENALDCLTEITAGAPRRTVFICGSMAELGSQSDHLHVHLGRMIADHCVNLLLATGPFAKTVANAAKTNAKSDLSIKTFENTDEICDKLQKFIQPDDIVLVKGSRQARLEKAIETIKKLFA